MAPTRPRLVKDSTNLVMSRLSISKDRDISPSDNGARTAGPTNGGDESRTVIGVLKVAGAASWTLSTIENEICKVSSSPF